MFIYNVQLHPPLSIQSLPGGVDLHSHCRVMDAEMGFDSLTLIWLARDGGILWSGIHVLLGVVLKVELESFYRLDFVREAC